MPSKTFNPKDSLIGVDTTFVMRVIPLQVKKYSYSMDTSRWTNNMLCINLTKRKMNATAHKVRLIGLTGPQFLKVTSKFNITLQADLSDWRSFLIFQQECTRNWAVCVLQRAYRSLLKKRLEKQYEYCSHVVKEIVKTEITFVTYLDVVINLIKKPLDEANVNESILTEEQEKTIFSVLENIQNTNHNLLDDLIHQCSIYSQHTQVGKIFLQLIPYLKMYSEYCKCNTAVSNLVGTTLAPPHPFSSFVSQQMTKAPPELKQQSILSLLITPVQRLPRYKLLLTDLFRHYWDTHDDYASLKRAKDEISKVVTFVNEMSRKQDSTEMLLYFTQHTQDMPIGLSICEPGRIYLRRDTVLLRETVVRSPSADLLDSSSFDESENEIETKEREQTLVLFNDMILFLSKDYATTLVNTGLKWLSYISWGMTKEPNIEYFHYYLHFRNYQSDVEVVGDNEILLTSIFCNKEDKVTLIFDNQTNRDTWFETASDYIEQQKQIQKALNIRRSGVFFEELHKEFKRRSFNNM
ncbi:guanine nucleotide exchange factor, putative [Entamoeba invadens IP1]|uniref:Guanine nucleotide exchange factor, putative n=1 Tax=Entamoeba invadens IP1 TaxID=370355 RepID=A0A0A1UCM8_ENTIV|nr:guanine nucleotide exchange factor, putative [Entamoeba invadens IP1]ELP92924.1 guanine nucleotide exchange factor, putative [Entamoeba invadens IP1]|eukprot:XP_004259695.1 guanine nucleotide exchange factor, putative [Entamoeba invadens IP1]